MMSKKDNLLDKINKLKHKIDELNEDLEAIKHEHSLYTLPDLDAVENFISSLPIETLSESLAFDKRQPRSKFSIKDLEHNYKLFDLYQKKNDELHSLESELIIAEVEYVQNKIEESLQ